MARHCARLDGERHLAKMETHLSALLETHTTADLVLTGKAGTIQHIGRLLRQRDIAAGRRQSKAYWAPGKAGLD